MLESILFDIPAYYLTLIILILIVVLVFGIAALLQWLWNRTCPEVFGLKPIKYWQAFRLLVLALILFSGIPS